MSENKIAVYICKGCDIGESIDVDALEGMLEEDEYEEAELEPDLFRIHEFLCGEEGLELIRSDIREGVNTLVVAGCSARFKTETFKFDGCRTERVNLREHVAWSHEPNDEDTQMLAADYLAMGIVRAQKIEMNELLDEEIDKTIMVVGGGQTGLTSALEASRAGYEVVLVEKEAKLGGWQKKFSGVFPVKSPYRDIQEPEIHKIIEEVEGDSRITVHTDASIEKITGQPGQFDVSLKSNGTSSEFRIGAIVQATGWKPYDASKLEHLGYGKFQNVITNVEMEEMLAAGSVTRPSDGKPARRIAFIQCAGSRDKDHLPYCSAVCCRVTLKQSLKIRELDEDAQAYVLYKDIRAPGQYESFYLRVQEDPGIFFTKGEVDDVTEIGDGNLSVDLSETLIEDHVTVEADLLVLATGMVPTAADGEAIRKFIDAQDVIEKGEEGAQLEAAKVTVEELKHLEGTEILNLDYRQGPDLPQLNYSFPDSHFICFPYESRRTGIYAAGCVRAPGDRDACREDAAGAVLKAIQCVELSSQGLTVHPRWGDSTIPDFVMSRCTQCKRCTEECPFGSLNEDEKGTPLPNPTRCRKCGICLGACPERIVSFADYGITLVSSMLKAVHVPDEFDEKPRFLGLLCENDAYPALDIAGLKRLKHSAYIRFIPVRCLGAVNTEWIKFALSKGFDGILMVGCKSGDDYQCHYIRGSELMGTRGDNIKEKLTQLVLEEERVRVEELSILEHEKLIEIINEFSDEIEEIGMNPFKGF